MCGKVQAAQDLVLDLGRRADDVSVVLGEASHPHQPMQDAAALIAVDRAQLCPTKGQFAVTAHPGLVDHDVEGAVHGFDKVLLALDIHGRVHIIFVEIQVPTRLPQRCLADVRRIHDLVPGLVMLLAPEVLDDSADARRFGVPVDQAWAARLVDAEEVQLPAQPAVIALLDLL